MITLSMVIGLVLGMTLTAYAKLACPECGSTDLWQDVDDPNRYSCNNFDFHGDGGGPCLTKDQLAHVPDDTWNTDKTISTDTTYEDGVEVTADITLTINEGMTLTLGGIYADNHTLTVKGSGNLVVNGLPEKWELTAKMATPGQTM